MKHSCIYIHILHASSIVTMYRVAVETLWNILPELKVEPDEELQTRVSPSLLYCVALQCERNNYCLEPFLCSHQPPHPIVLVFCAN